MQRIQDSILFHFALAILGYFFPSFIIVWVVLIFVRQLIRTFNKKSTFNEFLGVLIYISLFEIILRLTRAPFPHEGIKYFNIFLIIAYLINFKFVLSRFWIFLGLSLFISVPLMSVLPVDVERIRQLISANLSGPFLMLLLFSICDKNRITLNIEHIFRKLLLPSFTLLPLLFLLTPSISQIEFSTNANFEASGYGPNQMASILGLICTVSFYAFVINIKIFKTKYLLIIIFGLSFFRLVFTFSRGGLFTFLFLAFLIFIIDQRISLLSKTFLVGLFLILGLVFYNYTNKVTNNSFQDRVSFSSSDNLNQYSSNRVDIITSDIKIFIDNPFLGIGPGAGFYIRTNYGSNFFVNAHTEQTRLLAEHGLVGLLILILIIQRGFNYFLLTNKKYKIITIIFVVTSFSFMLHSATRLASPLILLPISGLLKNN